MHRGGLVHDTETAGGVAVTGEDVLGDNDRTAAGEMGAEESVLDDFFAGRPINRDDVVLAASVASAALFGYWIRYYETR